VTRQEKFEPDLTAGPWWRFTRYEVRDGFICPAAGAKLERYDLWAECERGRLARAARKKGETSDSDWQPPYVELQHITQMMTGVAVLGSRAFEEAVVAWCGRYGLLGVLPQLLLAMTLPGRWAAVDFPADYGEQMQAAYGISIGHFLSGRRLIPRLVTYERSSSGWRTINDDEFHTVEALERWPRDASNGDLLPADLVAKRWPAEGGPLPQPGSALIYDFLGYRFGDCRRYKLVPIEMVGGFFPDIPPEERQTYPYPQPSTEDFWRLYREPIADFYNAALQLAEPIAALTDYTAEPSLNYVQGLAESGLHNMVGFVSPQLAREGVDYRMRWLSPSLLADLAYMALDDIAAGARVATCRRCGRLFMRHREDNVYCSATCAQTARKRRQRDREAAVAQRLLGLGLAIEDVATSMQRTRTEIRRYQACQLPAFTEAELDANAEKARLLAAMAKRTRAAQDDRRDEDHGRYSSRRGERQ
jgi:predicted nucleic acid-binding Zn ribbon protein